MKRTELKFEAQGLGAVFVFVRRRWQLRLAGTSGGSGHSLPKAKSRREAWCHTIWNGRYNHLKLPKEL